MNDSINSMIERSRQQAIEQYAKQHDCDPSDVVVVMQSPDPADDIERDLTKITVTWLVWRKDTWHFSEEGALDVGASSTPDH